MKKVAVVGTGIAGNVVSYLLSGDCELTVFEQNDYPGGHTHTVQVETEEGAYAIDTGFIVFNEERYPHFARLLHQLGVASQPTCMSFGVWDEASGLAYSSRAFFAQPKNAFSTAFWGMLRDIARFRSALPRLLVEEDETRLLGDFVAEQRYSRSFLEKFLYPMGASLWSSDPQRLPAFPVKFLAHFFLNHRFLDLWGQPEWRVVCGGSHAYVHKLVAPFRDRIRLSTPVESIQRCSDHVLVTPRGGLPERFDEVVMATHADQALALLLDATPQERTILGSFPFQENVAVLHTDKRALPPTQKAWAAWNAYVPTSRTGSANLTYNMTLLQGLPTRCPYLVTLNPSFDLDPSLILHTVRYQHPLFSVASLQAQRRHAEISGPRHTHFCGAYWGFGFHEDGVESALAVARSFGYTLS